MLKRACLFLIFLLTSIAGFSQYNQTARERKDSIRSVYMEEYPDDYAIWPMLKYKAIGFSMEKKNEDRPSVAFNPNNDLKMGAGFYLFEASFEVSFNIPVPVRDESRYGQTKALDLQLNMLGTTVGIDLYYQRYSGYYKNNKDVKIPAGEAYPLRPDITTHNLGGSAFYVWNNKKFSIRSSYNYADRQRKSAGSFIVYGTINSFRVEGDSSILSTSEQEEFGEGSDFSRLRYNTFSLAPGYSYNLVIKRVFLNGTFALGPAGHWIQYQADGADEHEDILVNTAYMVRLAAGYNGNRFFTGTSLVLQSRIVSFEDIQFKNSGYIFRFVAGYRFREKGFLKKKLLKYRF